MPGRAAIGMPLNSSAGAPATAERGPIRADDSLREQRRLLASPAPQQEQPQRPLQRQRQPRPSLRSSLLGAAAPLAAAAPTPIRPSRLRASVETLVRKLSRHSLQSPSPPPEPKSPPIASPPPPPPPLSAPKPVEGPPVLDASLDFAREDWSAQHVFGELYSKEPHTPRPPSPVATPASPIHVDDMAPRPPSAIVAMRPSGVYYSYHPSDHMDIQQDSGSTPCPAIIPCSDALEPAPLEGMGFIPSGINLEVDDGYCNGNDMVMDYEDGLGGIDRARIETFMATRRPTPGGTIIRRNAEGIPLRYRLSADAALRCQNLVRSKPRMRRRKKIMRADGTRERANTGGQQSRTTPTIALSPAAEPVPPPTDMAS